MTPKLAIIAELKCRPAKGASPNYFGQSNVIVTLWGGGGVVVLDVL